MIRRLNSSCVSVAKFFFEVQIVSPFPDIGVLGEPNEAILLRSRFAIPRTPTVCDLLRPKLSPSLVPLLLTLCRSLGSSPSGTGAGNERPIEANEASRSRFSSVEETLTRRGRVVTSLE